MTLRGHRTRSAVPAAVRRGSLAVAGAVAASLLAGLAGAPLIWPKHGAVSRPIGKLAARATLADPNDGVSLTVLPAILPMFTAPVVPPLRLVSDGDD